MSLRISSPHLPSLVLHLCSLFLGKNFYQMEPRHQYPCKESANLCRASQMALVVKNLPANAGDVRDVGSISGLGRCRGGRHGNPLQYSCLENPMNSMKRQKDIKLEDELLRSVGVHCAKTPQPQE